MRIIFTIFILILASQSLSKADDIRDFEIEGISIGDSVLNFFSMDEIKNNTWDYFKNKEFTPLQFYYPKFAKTYDAIDIQYKTNDNDYKIMGLSGIIFYTDKKKINECYKKMDEIIIDVRSSIENLKETKKSTYTHTGVDDGGKSTVTQVSFENEGLDAITIQCYNYSTESQNHLRIGINTYEYRYFLENKAYN